MMRIFFLGLLLGCIANTAGAQNIVVQPYLQDAEPTSIKVMWESNGGNNHRLDLGTIPTALNQTIVATSNASQGSNLIHVVKIDNLTPNTAYYYRVNSDAVSSAVHKFITPPLKSSEQSFNLIAMSDMQRDGSHPNKFQEVVHDGVIPYVEQQFGADLPAHLGLVMVPGDLVVNGNTYSQWKNHFFDPAHPLFAQVPIYPVLGNHENNSTFYFQYFELPDNGTTGFEEHWWYKDYSNLRIIGLNSNGGYRIQAQLDWLQGVLDEACADDDLDFVFVQLHHPFKSELWTPGELDYTGQVIERMETFTNNCGKPSLHFFGHTHGYSRGQSRDHEHLWVNVATAGGAIDNWGEFPNADYEEFSKSIDEYGFVVVNVAAGEDPHFTLRRISRGDQSNTLNNVEQDVITLKRTDNAPQTPTSVFPDGDEVNPDCLTLVATAFTDPGDSHQASHWQVAANCNDFSTPVYDSWKQHENWYNEVNTQANDDLTDEMVNNLAENSSYCWRVRYRDAHLKWSAWSNPASFTTGISVFTSNLISNPGGENGVDDWTVTTGTIESLGPGECNGGTPRSGAKYLAVGGLCDGNETAYSEVFQSIDVSGNATEVDGGEVEVSFGGFLADFNGSDRPAMSLAYLSATGSVLGNSTVLSAQNSSWTEVQALETIPVSTRTIHVILTGTRNAGTDNDSYFDDLQLRLNLFPGNNCSAVLPVELSHLTAHCTGHHTTLSWETAAEEAITDYQIESSPDGRNWRVIGHRQPLNAGVAETHYQFETEDDTHGRTAFYRIKIIEADRSSRYSPVVSAECASPAPSISVFPNPVSGTAFRLFLDNPEPSPITITVVNLLGQEVYRQELIVAEGEHQLRIGDVHWATGIYTLTVSSPEWQWSSKLLRE